MKIVIAVATQNKLAIKLDECYMPVFVGKELKKESMDFNYQCDNIGDNISKLNPKACELTALYWIWKNVESDYYGLVHYRRFFKGKNGPITQREIEDVLVTKKNIVPKKNKYYIENLYKHYSHTHYKEHLNEVRNIIIEQCPEYLSEFDRAMKRKSAHMYNMFIMDKPSFNNYMTWLFEILFELDKRIDVSTYSAFQKRYLGRVSELLFDVWINYNKISYVEKKVLYTGKKNRVKKILRFLKSFVTRDKYEKSA